MKHLLSHLPIDGNALPLNAVRHPPGQDSAHEIFDGLQ